jgi:hypothetical protein
VRFLAPIAIAEEEIPAGNPRTISGNPPKVYLDDKDRYVSARIVESQEEGAISLRRFFEDINY